MSTDAPASVAGPSPPHPATTRRTTQQTDLTCDPLDEDTGRRDAGAREAPRASRGRERSRLSCAWSASRRRCRRGSSSSSSWRRAPRCTFRSKRDGADRDVLRRAPRAARLAWSRRAHAEPEARARRARRVRWRAELARREALRGDGAAASPGRDPSVRRDERGSRAPSCAGASPSAVREAASAAARRDGEPPRTALAGAAHRHGRVATKDAARTAERLPVPGRGHRASRGGARGDATRESEHDEGRRGGARLRLRVALDRRADARRRARSRPDGGAREGRNGAQPATSLRTTRPRAPS